MRKIIAALLAATAIVPVAASAQEEPRRPDGPGMGRRAEWREMRRADAPQAPQQQQQPQERRGGGDWGQFRGQRQDAPSPMADQPRFERQAPAPQAAERSDGGGWRGGDRAQRWGGEPRQPRPDLATEQARPEWRNQQRPDWRNDRGDNRADWRGDQGGRPDWRNDRGDNRADWRGDQGGRPDWRNDRGDNRADWRGGDGQQWRGDRADPRPDRRDERAEFDRRQRRDDSWNDRRANGGGWAGDRWAGGSWRGDQGGWNRDWRRDRRYDWSSWRSHNERLYRLPRYYAPPGWGYGYRRFSIGVTLAPQLWGQGYWLDDPWSYRLPEAYGPYRWVRYFDDALLVDIRTGRVVDVVYDIFY